MKHLLCSTADPSMTRKRVACAFRTIPEEIVSYPLNSIFENPSTLVKPDSFSDLNHISYHIVGSCNGLLCLYDTGSCSRFILYNPSIKLKSKETPRPSPVWRLHYESGKYVSGTLNWVSRYKGDVAPRPYMILSFDSEKETYRQLLMPQNVGDDNNRRGHMLYDLNNCLCVCYAGETHFVVWLMKEYGLVESWTKLTTIPREMFTLSPLWYMFFISENGVLLMSTPTQLILYNINSGGFDFHSISSYSNRYFHPHIYHESLISPPRW